jgi:hypothetical protein
MKRKIRRKKKNESFWVSYVFSILLISLLRAKLERLAKVDCPAAAG